MSLGAPTVHSQIAAWSSCRSQPSRFQPTGSTRTRAWPSRQAFFARHRPAAIVLVEQIHHVV